MKFRGTAIIALLIICAYFLMSSGQLYIYPISKMYYFGVSQHNLIGAFTYHFMHVGIKHLLVNLIVLVPIGLIAENRFGWKHILGLFFFSSITAGILYALLVRGTWVIGASAGIAGLLVGAYMADLKRTLIIIFACVTTATLIAVPLAQAMIGYLEMQHEEKINETIHELKKMNETVEKVHEKIEEKKRKGEDITPEIKVLQNISLKMNETVEKKKAIETQKITIEKGSEEESRTPPSMLIHLFGALAGLTYVYAFKREAFEWLIDDLRAVWKFLKRGKKHAYHKS